MRRKYEVWVGGKPLTIGGRPDPLDSSQQVLALRIDSPEEIAPAVAAFSERKEIQRLELFGDDVEQVWEWFMGGYRFVQAAGGCVTDERKRLLAIHRLGVWDLPKGKVDRGESAEQGALREVREECGLQRVEFVRRLCCTWHTYEREGQHCLKRTDWYLMRASGAEQLTAQNEEGITEVRWMDRKGIAELRAGTYPSLQRVINAWEAALDQA